MKTLRLLPVALFLVAFTALAGTVEVTVRPPMAHADVGRTTWDGEANLQVLSRHLQRLGQQYLPAGQTLKVELIDVDLAGSGRLVTGGADYPRIRLRYTLEVPGQAPRTAEEVVRDLDYARGMSGAGRNEALHYEKRMLRAWFRERFASA